MFNDTYIIVVHKDGFLDGVPAHLERWRKAMNDIVTTHFDKVAAIESDQVCFIRARLIEIEEPTLIQELCSAPASAVKCYRLADGLWRQG